MPSRSLFSAVHGDWHTPVDLYEALHGEFAFTLDPCPPEAIWDGRILSWAGERVFCNPPYGPAIASWLEKAGEAETAVYLLPARTDTRWFHDLVLPKASEIRFIRGRVRFANRGAASGRATFPSMIVVYGAPASRGSARPPAALEGR